ncbi:MAG: DMT family transporter [Dehalococcoidia bacterium]
MEAEAARSVAKRSSTTLAWLLVLVAGFIEVAFALALKESDGFSKLWPSVIAMACGGCSFGMLTWALRSLPVGTAYAVWTGLGAAGTVIVGIIALDEPSSAGRLISVALVLAGIVGLKLYEKA